jgi:hypothetical protein
MRYRALFSLALAVLLSQATSGKSHAGLVVHYTFDETSGMVAHDSAGNADGTLSGGATFVPGGGRFGGAVRLDSATDSFVNFGDHFSFDGSKDFSIQAWFSTSATTGQIVYARHFATHNVGYIFGVNDIGDSLPDRGTAHFVYGNGPDGTLAHNGGATTLSNLDDGQFHQAVETYQAGGSTKLYIDGMLQDTRSAVPINTTPQPFVVGGLANSSGIVTGYFTGLIDDVRIYDNVLSAADVNSLFTSNATPTAVPEPATFGLAAFAAIGGIALSGLARRKRSAIAS